MPWMLGALAYLHSGDKQIIPLSAASGHTEKAQFAATFSVDKQPQSSSRSIQSWDNLLQLFHSPSPSLSLHKALLAGRSLPSFLSTFPSLPSTMAFMLKTLLFFTTLAFSVDAYWLMGAENVLVTERLDPIVSPGQVSSHVHTIFGGSNFGSLSTAVLRQSQCTSVPIAEDKSNYWVPQLYFQHKNGSFTSVYGGAVFDPAGNITAFPDNFRMISGTPSLRSYDPSSYAQQAITYICLDFNGVSSRFNQLPPQQCPSGIRAQINFPSCWDGKNVDSPDHKSHVAFRSEGPDKGSCTDPNFPVEIPRIFMEVYWSTGDFSAINNDAMNQTQPFVFANGDATGYGYHGDYVNGWDAGVLQRAVDHCNCNIYGDPSCCAQQNIFTLKPNGQQCSISPTVNEQVSGTIDKLPGNNPVTGYGAVAPAPAPPAAQVNVPSGNPGASPSSVNSAAKGTPSPSASMSSPPAADTTPGTGQNPPASVPKPSSPLTMSSSSAAGTSSPSASMPPPPAGYTSPGAGQNPPASNATVTPPSLATSSSPPAGHTPHTSPSGCESAKVVTVTVTVTVDPKAHKGNHATPTTSHPIPSASETDGYCDETPSSTFQPATPTPKTKASRSIRARHNAGRRFLHNGHSF